MTPELRPSRAGDPPIEIHRSQRRRRSASASARDGVIVVRLPAGMSPHDEQQTVSRLVRKVTGQQKAAERGGDDALHQRANALADRYLDGVRATSVRWSSRMTRQHGSCTPSDGTIRISSELARAPDYVLDAVLVHELAHLHVSGHTAAFKQLLNRYPHAQRAQGWLEGHAAGMLDAGVERTLDEQNARTP